MESLGKITQGKGEPQQQQDQNVFHGQTSILRGEVKSIVSLCNLCVLGVSVAETS